MGYVFCEYFTQEDLAFKYFFPSKNLLSTYYMEEYSSKQKNYKNIPALLELLWFLKSVKETSKRSSSVILEMMAWTNILAVGEGQ